MKIDPMILQIIWFISHLQAENVDKVCISPEKAMVLGEKDEKGALTIKWNKYAYYSIVNAALWGIIINMDEIIYIIYRKNKVKLDRNFL